jgi:hypothetical protein
MASGNEDGGPTGRQRLDEVMRGVRALTIASKRRHRLARNTPEYAAALETEARLADRIWGLGAALGSDADDDDRAPAPQSTETSTSDQGARKT